MLPQFLTNTHFDSWSHSKCVCNSQSHVPDCQLYHVGICLPLTFRAFFVSKLLWILLSCGLILKWLWNKILGWFWMETAEHQIHTRAFHQNFKCKPQVKNLKNTAFVSEWFDGLGFEETTMLRHAARRFCQESVRRRAGSGRMTPFQRTSRCWERVWLEETKVLFHTGADGRTASKKLYVRTGDERVARCGGRRCCERPKV